MSKGTNEERRERARGERQAVRKRMARRQRTWRLVRMLAPLVAIAALLGIFFLSRGRSPTSGPVNATVGRSIDPSILPGIQTGPAPWPPEEIHLRARLSAIGLPVLSAEAFTIHIHQHLDLFVDGRQVTVPALIGINEQEGFLSPIHTHDSSGIIHVESPTVRAFTLGQFFDVWGVRFTQSCLGAYCNGGGRTLRMFANGHPVTGTFRQLELTAHEEITVAYGTDAQIPHPIPSSYAFPLGL